MASQRVAGLLGGVILVLLFNWQTDCWKSRRFARGIELYTGNLAALFIFKEIHVVLIKAQLSMRGYGCLLPREFI